MPRAGVFLPEDRLPYDDQAQIGDYRRSGYDRGHMSPRAICRMRRRRRRALLANVVPQTAQLNRGIWEGVETAVRNLAVREGEIYLVTGPAFVGSELQSIGANGVLVPTSTWKAVYDPQAGGTGVYVCQNTKRPRCAVVSVAALIRTVGIDPFPGLPDGIKATAMTLPEPEVSAYAPRRRRYPPLLDSLPGPLETP